MSKNRAVLYTGADQKGVHRSILVTMATGVGHKLKLSTPTIYMRLLSCVGSLSSH